MQIQTFNKVLKESLLQLVHNGYAKSIIGKILLGNSGAAAVMNGFNQESGFSFGLKPLTRIAKVLDREVHLVIIDPDDPETAKLMQDISVNNVKFINDLTKRITDFMVNQESGKINSGSRSVGRNDKIHQAKVDELLKFLE